MKKTSLFASLLCVLVSTSNLATAVPPTFTISGHVQTGAGTGVEDVDVVGNNGVGEAVTDANGVYSVSVPNNWNGMITVTKTGWLITPTSRTYSNMKTDITNENFTAYQPKISGHVLEFGGSPLTGVTVTANNGGGIATTDINGYYETFVPYNWNGAVSASLTYWSFDPDINFYQIYHQTKPDKITLVHILKWFKGT